MRKEDETSVRREERRGETQEEATDERGEGAREGEKRMENNVDFFMTRKL